MSFCPLDTAEGLRGESLAQNTVFHRGTGLLLLTLWIARRLGLGPVLKRVLESLGLVTEPVYLNLRG